VTLQRILDLVLSALALLVLAPLLVPIALILRFTGEGEIFYVQQRVGRGGSLFGLYKFATMLKNSPNVGTGTVTLKNDPRVLPIGRFLRKTKINELPQLLNIVRGDMSLVGPRPQTQRCFDAFPQRSKVAIMTVRPGLSGVGSIVFRDEEDLMHASADPERFYDSVIMPYKGLLEEWYVTHQGLGTYLLTIALTAWVVLVPSSAIFWRVFPDLPLPPPQLVAAGGARGAPLAPVPGERA
jgi:lipopolysaccharide/colanic/teichoic acid biosynthesis glycosyltransferase